VERGCLLRGLKGAKPLSVNHLPLPLDKGKGIKGIGFIRSRVNKNKG
jgi:hypothetical protein